MSDMWVSLGAILAALGGVLAALWNARRKGRAEGRSASELEGLRDAQERTERGRAAVQTGRASGATPDERLRRNDGAWP